MDFHLAYPHFDHPYRGVPPEIRTKIWQYCFEDAVRVKVQDDEPEWYKHLTHSTDRPAWDRHGQYNHAGFSTGLYPELLRLNKKTHLEVMEARSKYLHLFLDQCSFDTDPSPRKAAPPYQTQPGFKSLIVSCTFDEWTKNEVLGPPIEADITCLPLRYKIGDLIILEDEAPIPRDWHHDRKHLRFFDLVSERHVQRLMIAPRVTLTDRNHPAQIDQWIEEYGFDDLSSEKRDKLELSIVEVSIPRLPGVDSRDIQQPAKQARGVRVVRISLKLS